MYCKLTIAALALFIGYDFASGQEHIPSTTTAAELWNPWTWFWPYAKAAAEGYRDYYDKAQKATNELYQQIYKTNAFPWVTGDWSFLSPNKPGGNGGQTNEESQGGNGGQGDQGNGGQGDQGNGGQGDQGNGGQEDQGNGGQEDQGNGGQGDQGNGGQGDQGNGEQGDQGNGGQEDQENGGQEDQENSETAQEENTPETGENQPESNSGTGAQIEGNVQDDGTADANANVEGQELQV